MKKLRQLFAPVALTLLLSASASAGIMSTDLAPPPPPPTTAATATVQYDGFMSTGFTATDPVTITVLSVLQSVLAR